MKTYSTGQFAKCINKSIKTIQRWDTSGKLKAHRTPTNKRYYLQSDVDKYFGKSTIDDSLKIFLYGRVSSHSQKNDLAHQIEFLKQYANAHGYQIEAVLQDIGSGMNYKRRNWNKLIKMMLNGEHIKVVVTYPDRFIRFGFDWFNQLFQDYNCEIEVINHEKLSATEELVQDLISIIQVFSSKLYGLRKYKTKLTKDDQDGDFKN